MSKANGNLSEIVYSEAPIKTSSVISRLYESGYEVEQAAEEVAAKCEIESRNGEDYVIGVKEESESETFQVSGLDREPGEPTGQYFTGKILGGEPQLTDNPVGLPVLEDVGHPLVPQLGHEYKPREMPYGSRTDLEVVVRALADPDYATLLIGETGVGKNVLLKKIAEVCNYPSQRVNFGLGVDYESLVGRFAPSEDAIDMEGLIQQSQAVSQGSDGLSTADVMQSISAQKSYFEFVSGILRQCAMNGFMFIGDEINTVTGEVTSSLHGVTEELDSRELVIQDTSEVITPHERFNFVGTMNPVDYAGTNTLNRAFQTRFTTINIPYLEKQPEIEIILEKSNLGAHENGERIAEGLVTLATKLRAQRANAGSDDGVIMTAVSSRDLIKIGNMICDPDGEEFMDPKSATKMILDGLAAPGDWSAISVVVEKTNLR